MAKRKSGGNRTMKPANMASMATTAPPADAGTTTDAMEQRVVAFAEQLGRIVGTVQARTEGWMDRDALNAQVAGVRDSASELLDQLKNTVSKGAAAVTRGGDATEATGNSGAAAKGSVSAASSGSSGRSGASRATGAKKTAAAATTSNNKGRSGGFVDAPGKKHRKPMPAETRSMAADTKKNVYRGRQSFVQPLKRNGRG